MSSDPKKTLAEFDIVLVCASSSNLRYRCFGLGNNFSYVIMLSAALDIIKKQEHSGAELQLRKYHINCTETGTGVSGSFSVFFNCVASIAECTAC
ncbi:unnamed protein product [Echinostoma caproni]|uniref:ThiF domain-containing protein n=1 Tax=Echinostoma caproni TaxID=27848 RepID=A0A183A177_9TREM|nr:unnamed protein product [Echinostoma caproni]